jgi:hypothetical protein
MWVIVHALSGMALGAALGPEVAGLPLWAVLLLALAAHAVLDIVPHWDYTRRPEAWAWAAGDVLVSTAALLLVWGVWDAPSYVFWAGLVSAIPDLDVLDAVIPLKTRGRLFPSHWRGYPHGRARPFAGLLTQGAVVVVSLAVLVSLF